MIHSIWGLILLLSLLIPTYFAQQSQFFEFSNGNNSPFQQRSESSHFPEGVKRTKSYQNCTYDATKWSMQSDSSIARAVMFYRKTGISCTSCLRKCAGRQNGEWTCRSVVFDSIWKICDLFAVAAGESNFNLVKYTGRHYFGYIPALPPTDSELRHLKDFAIVGRPVDHAECGPRTDEFKGAKNSIPFGISKQIDAKNVMVFKGDTFVGQNGKKSRSEGVTSHQLHKPRKHKIEKTKPSRKFRRLQKYGRNSIDFGERSEKQRNIETSELQPIPLTAVQEEKVSVDRQLLLLGDQIERESALFVEAAEKEEKSSFDLPDTKNRGFGKTHLFRHTSLNERAVNPSLIPEFRQQHSDQNAPWSRQPRHFHEIEKESDELFASLPIQTQEVSYSMDIDEKPIEMTSVRTTTEESVTTTRNIRRKYIKPSETRAATPFCPPKFVPAVSLFWNSTNNFVDGLQTQDSTLEECTKTCGESTECVSAVFTGSNCILNLSKSRAFLKSLIYSNDATFIKKICLPRTMAKKETENSVVISALVDHILVGHVVRVENAHTFQQCVAQCIRSHIRHKVHCKSAMWYPKDKKQNCLLNSETSITKPDKLLHETTTNEMIYFEVPTESVGGTSADDEFRRKDDPIHMPKWTGWSGCEENSNDEMRFRYMKCNENIDVRKCPKQTAFCGPNPHRPPQVSDKLDVPNV